MCTSKHASENAVGWISDAIVSAAADKIRLGIAHGSLDGLSPDFNKDYFPMTSAELEQIDVHAWLLGHTHVRFPDVDAGRDGRIFYPSTPEPDGFDCRHGGHAWVIEISQDGQLEYRSLSTGTFRFRSLDAQQLSECELRSETHIKVLRKLFESYRTGRELVKLKLCGRLDRDLFEQLGTLHDQLATCVEHLEFDDTDVLRAVRQDDIDAEFTQDSFPHRLLSELGGPAGDPLALQLAYEMIQEAR